MIELYSYLLCTRGGFYEKDGSIVNNYNFNFTFDD